MTPVTREELDWWASLVHGGMLIAPARIAGHFSEPPAPLSHTLSDRLRRDVARMRDGDTSHLSALLDTVLEEVVGLKASLWTKGADVDARWSQKALTGETIRPRRVWHALPDGAADASPAEPFVLPLFIAESPAAERQDSEPRLGIGRGRRAVSRVVEWLRKSGQPIALLTNGRQWRLLHAGADYDAWCEWDTALWFEEGVPSAQVTALRTLLAPAALTPPRNGAHPSLVQAILDSRRGQAELSAALGERVRQAVELLIRESSQALASIDGKEAQHVSRRELYIAATRMMMRCVVILFAEARDLLPRDNPVYHGCYGIQGLREQLARQAGGRADRLRNAFSAWPRLLALFDLVQRGSPHEAIPIPAYGGGLFTRGDSRSRDGVLRALAAFESPANELSDLCIHQILELLTVSRVKVRQRAASTWVNAPVDFSDLSSEYIGILYEGLLDFELHRAPPNDAVMFLQLGDEPALPLSRLEAEMAPRTLSELIGKLKKSTKKLAVAESDDEEEAAEEDDDDEASGEPESAAAVDAPSDQASRPEADDGARVVRERAQIWAEKAVKEAKLVPYPRDDTDPVVRERWNREVSERARSLYRLVLPGEWYLVRWGGTRKGAGTFYTRPQLAVPTVRRTLEPLCFEPQSAGEDRPRVRTPEQLLALKVCDPAAGSGSFLVSSLRYLTDALVESLHVHRRLVARADGAIAKLADGLPLEHPSQETLPLPPDHPDFDDRLRARLKRHVVERCIYGVDIDPLAVELARMALWIETMDRSLPFGFLDHKLRCGNALVGAWFDRFRDYPVMAFVRDDAGDAKHERFVHHYREYTPATGRSRGQLVRKGDKWTAEWKRVREDVIKPALRDWIGARGAQYRLAVLGDGVTPERVHDDALQVFTALHNLPMHAVGERERVYREQILGNAALEELRLAFDAWCAIWFWPGDELDAIPAPTQLSSLSPESRAIVQRLREAHRFFHWELEFPDVFVGAASGFDAIVGNPPWETQQPSSKEFFSNIDPLYRTYGKQEALREQRRYFEADADDERDWLAYCAYFKSFATWNRFAAGPFGDGSEGESRFALSRSVGENAHLHDLWRASRVGKHGYADDEHPFQHQGDGKPYTYKMFVEAGRALLRDGGYLGFITPSGIYTDKGSTELRKLLLERNRWEWLFGFENRQGIFDIHRSFKFNPIIVRKGGETTAIRAAFMHRAVEDWQEAERHVLPYPRERVAQFSPRSSAILEIRSERDLAVLEKMYANSVLLGDDGPDGWGIQYRQGDFNMTSDASLFPPRTSWEEKGYKPNEYGMWVGPGGDVALPLYEGRMIGQFDFSEKGWVSGKGRSAVWREIPWEQKVVEPQYLMSVKSVRAALDRDGNPKVTRGEKLVFMDITSATNARTMIASALIGMPCGNSAPVLDAAQQSAFALSSVVNSFAYDFAIRLRCGGLHLNYFVIEESPLPAPSSAEGMLEEMAELALRLTAIDVCFSPVWAQGQRRKDPWKKLWAITEHERLRLRCILDALAASSYGLTAVDFEWILQECDMPAGLANADDASADLNSKGFWRIDKALEPELRHTVLSLVAFRDLQRLGLKLFLTQNDGEGWMIPRTLRLADYGLGHDERAKEHQPVASRLGPRFLPWQLEQGADESWEECARHATQIEALVGPNTSPGRVTECAPGSDNEPPARGLQSDLFGHSATTPRKRRE